MSNLDRIERQIEAAQARAEKARKNADDKNKHVQQLIAKREAAEARELQKVMKGERAADTRRKILKGVCLDRLIEQGVVRRDQVDAMLDATLTRADERALFDLPALPESQAEPEGRPQSDTNVLLDEMRRL